MVLTTWLAIYAIIHVSLVHKIERVWGFHAGVTRGLDSSEMWDFSLGKWHWTFSVKLNATYWEPNCHVWTDHNPINTVFETLSICWILMKFSTQCHTCEDFCNSRFVNTNIGVTWLITGGGVVGRQNRPWILATVIYEGGNLDRRKVSLNQSLIYIHSFLPLLLKLFYFLPPQK